MGDYAGFAFVIHVPFALCLTEDDFEMDDWLNEIRH